ncbi:MAG TPA: G1 family glutamic endopeptidase [Trebonia sp.]|jgi:hypothetical protein|nr:G1 family glutamic endopeptidase [Trebonia sp.]
MHRSLRRTVFSALAIIPAAGLLIGLGTAAHASTHVAATSSAATAANAAQAKANAIAALKGLQVGFHTQTHPVGSQIRPDTGTTTQVTSTNWSGYADLGTTFTRVASSWTEPTPSCSGSSEQLAAFWVGIDGFSSSSVEQDGTLIECYAGGTYQYTWWEMYPTNAIQVVGTSLAAGDHITSVVSRSGSSYTLTVTDSTHTANSFSRTESCTSCSNNSAEWIAEAPSSSSGVLPLAKFSTWTNSSSSVTGASLGTGTISLYNNDEITMTPPLKAQPSALTSGGATFTVTWKHA